MSAQHTQGRLTLQLIEGWPFGVKLLDQFGNVVLHANAPCQSSEQKTRNDHELGIGFKINAKPGWRREDVAASVAAQTAFYRRMVACWNACEGIDIEVLDGAVAPGLIKRMVADKMRRVTAERDELLAALEDAQRQINHLIGYGGGTGGFDEFVPLIAKVKGGAA